MQKIHIIVKPNSKAVYVQQGLDGTLLVSVKEPPLDGRANKAVVEALSEYFNTNKSKITIVKGHKTKYKTVEIA